MNSNYSLPEVEKLVHASRPHPSRSLLGLAFVALAVVTILVIGLAGDNLAWPQWISVAVPWLLMGGLISLSWINAGRRRRVMTRLSRAMEAAEWNDWPRVGQIARELLHHPLQPPPLRGQAMLLLAGAAERAGAYDASEILFEALRSEPTIDPLQRGQATLGLAGAKLRSHQLTDAVRLLDGLRNVELPPGLRAGVELTRLFQEVGMGHHADAVASIATRKPLFRRYLATRAAYGYSLFAAALHALGRFDEAAALWRDATLLVDPRVLIERFDVLRGIADHYSPSECPL